jgi:hypothetical protein
MYEWNEYNYTLKYHHDQQQLGYSSNLAAQQAIAEALAGSVSHGMIARKPGDPTSDAIFVTHRGREAAEKSLQEIRP